MLLFTSETITKRPARFKCLDSSLITMVIIPKVGLWYNSH